MARPDFGQVVWSLLRPRLKVKVFANPVVVAAFQVAWYICTVVACIFLVGRLIVRWRLLKKLYLDDCFVVAAALCLIGDLAIQHYMFNLGMAPP